MAIPFAGQVAKNFLYDLIAQLLVLAFVVSLAESRLLYLLFSLLRMLG
jgi:hypothetical protein